MEYKKKSLTNLDIKKDYEEIDTRLASGWYVDDINTSKNMYMTIFQWLPYGGNKYNKVTKIFPNEKFNRNTNNLIKNKLILEYEAFFPDEIDEDKVDEYFVFVASEKNIPWLDEYSQIESLKSQISKSNFLMEKHLIGYIVIK